MRIPHIRSNRTYARNEEKGHGSQNQRSGSASNVSAEAQARCPCPREKRDVIQHRSELPADLGADAEVFVEVALEDVFVSGGEDLIGSIGSEEPGPGDWDLVANAEAKLRVLGADAVILEGLHHGHLEDELLIQIEEILQANRAAEGVGAGVIEFRVAGQGVSLEVDADVLQYARAITIYQGLRVAEAYE